MMTKPYLIRLYPVAPFLFGGEHTFGEGTDANYLAVSETWPQQTSLLGMLRYQLLMHHNLLPLNQKNNREKAAEFIGPESFGPDRANQFGHIECLSPVFMMQGDKPFRPTPVDAKFIKKKDKEGKGIARFERILTAGSSTAGRIWTGGQPRGFIPTLTGYNHKAECVDCLTSSDGQTVVSQSDVFQRHKQVGIKVDTDRQVQNNAFYKKETVQFTGRDWSFAVVADLKTALADAMVTLGAEQSLFRMQVTALPDGHLSFNSYETCFAINAQVTGHRIEFLSDALVLPSLYDHCTLAYTDTISFRAVKTTVADTLHYHNRLQKSHRLELVRRGSVLWSHNVTETLNAIDNPNFHRIGYNYVYAGPALPFSNPA